MFNKYDRYFLCWWHDVNRGVSLLRSYRFWIKHNYRLYPCFDVDGKFFRPYRSKRFRRIVVN